MARSWSQSKGSVKNLVHIARLSTGDSAVSNTFSETSGREISPLLSDLEGRLAVLQTPKFWSYESSTKQWVHQSSAGLSRAAKEPQGGGTDFPNETPVRTRVPHQYPEVPRVQSHKTSKSGWACGQAACQTETGFYLDETGCQTGQ